MLPEEPQQAQESAVGTLLANPRVTVVSLRSSAEVPVHAPNVEQGRPFASQG